MKINIKSLFLLLVIFLASCNKDDIHYNLDNTYWESTREASSEYIYALSFSNGYVTKLYKNTTTDAVFTKDYSAKYSVQGNKIIIIREYSNAPSDTFEVSFENGIIRWGSIDYYLR